MQFHVTSMDGVIEQEMQKHQGFHNWDCKFHKEGLDEVFDKEKVVYLSSESESKVTSLEAGTVYVIGGLVDHNRHKGV